MLRKDLICLGVSVSNKELSVASIDCGGTFSVTLSLSAEPDIVSNPTDIVLVLDRSGSMAGSPLANLKNGAKKFVQIIDEATDSAKDGNIGNGSRIGIVSFADTATQDTQLITSVSALDAAIGGLSANGWTNHADAFTQAVALFDPASANAKTIVMFTDGKTTAGPDPSPIAAAARMQGIIIYCIGLSGKDGVDEQTLNDWASDPDSAYVAITPDDSELEKLFEDLARNISKPGATGIVIDEQVNSCFVITSIDKPQKGTAELNGDTALQWKIDELGVKGSEGAALTFNVRHVGPCTGNIEVNDEIIYSDNEKNVVSFGSPKIYVDCGVEVYPEKCPEPVEIDVDGCQDTVEFDAEEIALESLGRIIQIDVTLKEICPAKRVALAVILTELDAKGDEYDRGMKIMTIPAHSYKVCRNIAVRCVKFVVPEDLNVSGGSMTALCSKRRFKARFIANYIDSGFECCNQLV